MYNVIYDYVCDDERCNGLMDKVDTYQEAIELRNALRESPCYLNIDIVEDEY